MSPSSVVVTGLVFDFFFSFIDCKRRINESKNFVPIKCESEQPRDTIH